MKVLALNSSPRTEGQSKTNLMLTSLVEGMQDAGAEVEAIELRRKTIKNCIGCYTCWTKTPGMCVHKEFAKKNLRPRPDSLEAFRLMMPLGFNPDSAKGLRATLQFEFTGEVEGDCHFVIADNAITAKADRAEKPDLTITSPFEVWMDIMTGKADGAQMLMEGEYTAEGNMDLLLNMSKIFGQS